MFKLFRLVTLSLFDELVDIVDQKEGTSPPPHWLDSPLGA